MNPLVNFVVLSKADNNKLGGVKPSLYKSKMPLNEESVRLILSKAMCPDNIFHDDYKRFTSERAGCLLRKANSLMAF